MSKIPILQQSRNSNQKENTIESKELFKQEEEDDDKCTISNMKYDNLRLLIERKDQDLNELREFANFERESLESQLFEQQANMTFQLLKLLEKEQLHENTLAKKNLSQSLLNGLTVKTDLLDKEYRNINNDAIKFQQIKIELIQCKAELNLIKKISLHESIQPINKDLETSKTQHAFTAKMVQMIDNEI